MGERIRHLLALREMSQADLVRLSGLSKATVSDLINNKQKTTSVDTIRLIARAVRVSPAYFMEENAMTPFEAVPHLPEHIKEFILNSENMDYLLLAHKLKTKDLPAEVVDKIIETYETIKNKK